MSTGSVKDEVAGQALAALGYRSDFDAAAATLANLSFSDWSYSDQSGVSSVAGPPSCVRISPLPAAAGLVQSLSSVVAAAAGGSGVGGGFAAAADVQGGEAADLSGPGGGVRAAAG